jgi:hypothetical protein
MLLLTLVMGLMFTQAAFGRSQRGKHAATSAPQLPPFPWTTIAVIAGPLLAIGAGAVILRSALAKEKSSPPFSASDMASLPSVWFVAATDIFHKFWTDRDSEPPHLATTVDYPGPAADRQAEPSDL